MMHRDDINCKPSAKASRKRRFRNNDTIIQRILTQTKTIALVGASDKVERPAYEVMNILLEYGYDVIPINPRLKGKILMGRRVLGSLGELQSELGLEKGLVANSKRSHTKVMVDIFRNSKAAADTIEEVISLGTDLISSVWMQIGVINENSAQRAVDAGFDVAMDVCPVEEIPRLGIRVPKHDKIMPSDGSGPSTKKQRRRAS
jgi:hypothetical protein